ncbi:MAG: hypothetical protein RBS13_03720 [Bacteroidales bacterium]|jgi:hypothetical protein|nr:hypothetical protein [Bacteroidales bacterium]
MKKFKFILILSSILFVSCDIITNTEDWMMFSYNSSDSVVAVYTTDNKTKDTFFINFNDYSYGFLLSEKENEQEGIDESTFLSCTNNLIIYRIKNNDTLFMNKEKFNHIDAWSKSVEDDMGIRIIKHYLNITDEMFK